jgi:hypothetical protein
LDGPVVRFQGLYGFWGGKSEFLISPLFKVSSPCRVEYEVRFFILLTLVPQTIFQFLLHNTYGDLRYFNFFT